MTRPLISQTFALAVLAVAALLTSGPDLASAASLTGKQRQQHIGLVLLPIGSDLVSKPPRGSGGNPPSPPPKTHDDDCMSCAD